MIGPGLRHGKSKRAGHASTRRGVKCPVRLPVVATRQTDGYIETDGHEMEMGSMYRGLRMRCSASPVMQSMTDQAPLRLQ